MLTTPTDPYDRDASPMFPDPDDGPILPDDDWSTSVNQRIDRLETAVVTLVAAVDQLLRVVGRYVMFREESEQREIEATIHSLDQWR